MEGSGFDYHVVFHSIPFLAQGMVLTLTLTFFAIGGGLLLGTLLALARLAPIRALSFAAGTYVNFFRSMPLILVIFWFYFLVPFILGFPIGDFYSVLVAFIMFEAAYYCEIMRAGINSIGRGQQYAAMAIGLTPAQVYRYVLLPVAFRIIIPPLTSDFLGVFKNSSLALTIGVLELTAMTRQIEEYSYAGFEAFTAATVLYIGVTAIVMGAMRIVEARVRIPGMISLQAK